MKKIILTLMLVLGLGLVGCGSSKDTDQGTLTDSSSTDTKEFASTEEPETEESMANTEEINVTPEILGTEASAGTGTSTDAGTTGDDNFTADPAKVKEFAQQIKDAVVGKNIELLSTLSAYPTYVSIAVTDDSVVKSRDEFMEIGAANMFTDEFVSAIAGANIDKLEPSEAGFTIMAADGTGPSITFGLVNGTLGITGINY